MPPGWTTPWSSGRRRKAPSGASSRCTAPVGVDDEVAPLLLLVGADPQQDEGADAGVGEVGVGQRLERFGDGLAVGRGVVLAGGDGEVAADGGDADALGDGDVGVAAEHVVVAGGRGPFDAGAAGCGLAGVALAPGVEEGDGAVGRDGPAQHPQVRHALAGPEDGEQLLPERRRRSSRDRR